jgi:hypothetical protein
MADRWSSIVGPRTVLQIGETVQALLEWTDFRTNDGLTRQ